MRLNFGMIEGSMIGYKGELHSNPTPLSVVRLIDVTAIKLGKWLSMIKW